MILFEKKKTTKKLLPAVNIRDNEVDVVLSTISTGMKGNEN